MRRQPMANNPKKIKDPTDTALTAIQEVLSTADQPSTGGSDTADDAISAPPRESGRRGARTSAPAPDTGPFDGAEADDLRGSQLSANDDRQSIGPILHTLQRRPAKTSYFVATIFAFAWVAGGCALAFVFMPDLRAVLSQGPAGIPAMIGLASFLLAPVIFFFLMAHVVWRSQELRIIAQSMASVAMRL